MNSFFSIDNTTVMLIPLAPSRLKSIELISWSGAETSIAVPSKDLYTWRQGVRGTTAASTGHMGTAVTLELIPNCPNTQYLMNVVHDWHNNLHHVFDMTVECHDVGDMFYHYQRGFLSNANPAQSLGSGPAPAMAFNFFFERIDADYSQAQFPEPIARAGSEQQ